MQKIASLLLKKNDIPFDKDELSFQIESHPSYPSLHSITGVFDHFNIENVAARVPNTQEVFDQLPNSFIAQLNDDNGQELVLLEKKKGSNKIYDTQGKSKVLSNAEFLEKFTGIILAAEKDENNTEKVSNNKGVLANIGFGLTLISLLTVFVLSTYSAAYSYAFYATFAAAVAGIFISVAILKQEFGIRSAIGDAFCSSDSEKKDCNAVLTSKGANIFGNYKLSDLSLIYFVGLTLGIFLLAIQGQSLQLIYWIGIVSLPITLYSIFYQAFTVKTWCLLCLSIVGLLWIQAAVPFLLDSFSFGLEFNITEVLAIFIGFVASFSIWSYVKPKYTEAKENKQYKLDYYKFKRKYSLFNTLLKNGSKLDTTLKNADEIVFGNPNSNVEIVVVTNPFCGHCKPVHTIVENILEQFNDQVKIIIRFNVFMNDKEGDVITITTNLLHIYHQKGQKTCLEAMDDAYNNMKPKEWISTWAQQNIDKDRFFASLEDQKEWCGENKINFTPEILINGYSFPKEYDRKDISFFIEELNEEYNQPSPQEVAAN
jgi:uncharacterized membrane protein